MNIYIGNLSDQVSDDDLRAAFSEYGAVDSAAVIRDRFSGRSRGFGFVEMADSTAAQSAIDGMNGKDLGGRSITVNQARPRNEGGGGGGRGGTRF